MSALRSHPDAHVCGEELVDHLRNNQMERIRKFLVEEPHGTMRASGFKTKYADIGDKNAFRDLLSSLDARLIVLERRNLVKQVVSFCTGEKLYEATGDWNLYDGQKPSNDKIEVPTGIFDRELQRMTEGQEQLTRFASSLRRPTLYIYYEDLIRDPEEVFGWVTRFLSLSPTTFEPKTEKNTSDDLSEVLNNYYELKAHYEGTRYEQMFG
jgi:hypothetical protein